MKKTRFLVDMDGVVANFTKKMLSNIYQQRPELHETHPPHLLQYKGFYVDSWFGGAISKEDSYLFYQHKGFFEHLEPIGDCVNMINYLQKNEIDIMFCTTPILYGEELWSLTEKAHWLRKHFGNWALRKLTLTSDKTTVIGKILIDDKEKIDGDENPTWTHILFDQPWNQSSESIRMKGGWTKENMDWLLSEFINK